MDVIDQLDELRKKGWENSNKSKKKIKKWKKKDKYKSRRDQISDCILPVLKKLWFNDDKDEVNEFVNWLLGQEEKYNEYSLADLHDDKEVSRVVASVEPAKHIYDIEEYIHKKRKALKKFEAKKLLAKMGTKKDAGIARLLNPDTYNKKYLNNSEYRKELKKLAKREQEELKEMTRMGFVDCSLEGYKRRTGRSVDEMLDIALSDTFAQKHSITNI